MHCSEVTGTDLPKEQSLAPDKSTQLILTADTVKDALVEPGLKNKDD